METRYQKLIVWQKSVSLVKLIYKCTTKFPKTEIYSLVDQMKRSATSIPANIAEWSLWNTIKENIQFLHITLWSAAELESHTLVAFELKFTQDIEKLEILALITEILKMLSVLIAWKKSKITQSL